MLQFKDWLLLSESIANNFDQFIADIKKYAQNNELELKTVEVNPQQKENIIKVLTDNKKESQDYLKYLLGFINTKSDARIEDYQQAIDVLIWAFENRVVNKQELVEKFHFAVNQIKEFDGYYLFTALPNQRKLDTINNMISRYGLTEMTCSIEQVI